MRDLIEDSANVLAPGITPILGILYARKIQIEGLEEGIKSRKLLRSADTL